MFAGFAFPLPTQAAVQGVLHVTHKADSVPNGYEVNRAKSLRVDGPLTTPHNRQGLTTEE
jgi:hypothetical protein